MTLNHSKWTLVHYSFEVIVVYCTASIELREETSFSLEQWNSVLTVAMSKIHCNLVLFLVAWVGNPSFDPSDGVLKTPAAVGYGID